MTDFLDGISFATAAFLTFYPIQSESYTSRTCTSLLAQSLRYICPSRTVALYCFLHNPARYPQEDTMKSSNRDKVEGTFHEVKGNAKEVAGKLCDNPKMKLEGTVEKIAGKAQEKLGQVKKVLGK